MFHVRRVAPTADPVSIYDVKSSARIDVDDEDILIDEIIGRATKAVEEMSGRYLMAQTWDFKLYGLTGDEKVRLPGAPVQSIDSISYQDENDATQTLTVGDFYIFSDDDCAYVQPKGGTQWPNTYDRPDALTISYVAGYSDKYDVPEELRQAIILLATHMYEYRAPVMEKKSYEMPYAVESLVGLQRRGWFGA